jgi:tetratricopeptide (TPR) repeat protein
MSTDDHLQRFATKVVELQEKKAARIDEELMREVARDLGMSEEDLLKVKEESRAHKQRAQALRSAGSLDDAINELETAWTFNPLDVELMYMLADGLFTRSQRTRDEAEWARAKELCLRVLEIAPAHSEAPSLLTAINNKNPAKQGDNAFPIALVIVGVGVVVLGVIAALVLLL